MARELGIKQALGNSRQGQLALWQVIARVMDQGSRLSAVRLATSHAGCDILGIKETFNENDLYANLDWLDENQTTIKKQFFENRVKNSKANELFLYDVTSSYLEGTENELSSFGYNWDRKRGKRQIVIGMLCDGEGEPISVEVFPGNTQDAQTFTAQVAKAAKHFGAQRVTFVGDRGMIKNQQIEDIGNFSGKDFHYITAISKPQVRTLLKSGVIQLDLFDNEIAEVEVETGVRYILRRNPAWAEETKTCREDKLDSFRTEVNQLDAGTASTQLFRKVSMS